MEWSTGAVRDTVRHVFASESEEEKKARGQAVSDESILTIETFCGDPKESVPQGLKPQFCCSEMPSLKAWLTWKR
jgi:hypothetical protein